MPQFPTISSQIQAFSNALYGLTLGSNSVNSVLSEVTFVGGLHKALNNYYTYSFSNRTAQSIADTVVANIGLTGDKASNFSKHIQTKLHDNLTSGGQIISTILDHFASMTDDPTYGKDAKAWNTVISNSLSYQVAHPKDKMSPTFIKYATVLSDATHLTFQSKKSDQSIKNAVTLRALRNAFGMSQGDLAILAGCSRPTINRIESLSNRPIHSETADAAFQVFRELGVEIETSYEDVTIRFTKVSLKALQKAGEDPLSINKN